MIGKQTKTAAIQNNRAPDRGLCGFQFADNLTQTDQGIFLPENIAKVMFHCFQQVNQGVGGATRFIKNIINFMPGCFADNFSRSRGGLGISFRTTTDRTGRPAGALVSQVTRGSPAAPAASSDLFQGLF